MQDHFSVEGWQTLAFEDFSVGTVESGVSDRGWVW